MQFWQGIILRSETKLLLFEVHIETMTFAEENLDNPCSDSKNARGRLHQTDDFCKQNLESHFFIRKANTNHHSIKENTPYPRNQ